MKDFIQRKNTRLKDFDYSNEGAYFVTICTKGRKKLLSIIVGEGLAPPELKPCGKIAKEQLLLLEKRYPCTSVESYVIMPNHIHMILLITGGASPSPTVSDIVCTFKSLTSRLCKKEHGIENIFQRSFYDHIIRNKEDFEEHIKYIYENPMRWHCDELYSEE